MRALIPAVFLAWLALAAQLQADQWTNLAGRVIVARLDGFDGVSVTFTRTNGSRLRIPVKALCESDQLRVRLRSGHSPAPSFVLDAYRDANAILERFARLPARQQTESARVATLRMARAVFDARLKDRIDELKEKNLLKEVKRLRDMLQTRPGS